jgi:AraC family transcriptional regulator
VTPARLCPTPAVLSSADTAWSAIAVEQHRLPALELAERAIAEHVVLLHLGAAGRLETRTNGSWQPGVVGPGDVFVAPAGPQRPCRWQTPKEVLVVTLPPAFLEASARDLGAGGHFELIGARGPDPQVYHLGLALLEELRQGTPSGPLFGDTLAAALAARLVQHYGARRPTEQRRPTGLSRAQLGAALDFLRGRLADPFSLDELAAATGLSPYHFARQFKRSTGLSPHQYLVRERVERAKLLLRAQRNKGLAAIAQEVGFADQSHFGRLFKRLVGVTPRRYR